MKLLSAVFLYCALLHVESNLFDDDETILSLHLDNTTDPTLPKLQNLPHIFLPTSQTDDEEYYHQRCAEIVPLRVGNFTQHPYPHKFTVTSNIKDILNMDNEMLKYNNVTVSIAGRVLKITNNSTTTRYEVKTDQGLVQMAIFNPHNNLIVKRGDIIGAEGHPSKTSKGLYIFVKKLQLLAPCLHKLPSMVEGKARYANRYLDLILNDKTMVLFQIRAKIISLLRNFLEENDFLEVETPILNKIPGGAVAWPFQTHFTSENKDYFLRIAPELFHKMLIVGGMSRIYEIGRVFRNEEADNTHNPEFTSVEIYMAYADYNDMMTFTETLLSNIVMELFGTLKIHFHPEGPESKGAEIDFTPPYVRKPMIPTLEKQLNVTFPPVDKLMETPEGLSFLTNLANKHKVSYLPPRTAIHLLQGLVKKFISEKTVSPTFITDFPQSESPLAKYHRVKRGLSERFELYILKKEISNSYTELNDPFAQREYFAEQDKQREEGDTEIPPTDEEFIKAMEYGLPPTAGLGIGIDRLVMLLTNSTVIQGCWFCPYLASRLAPLTRLVRRHHDNLTLTNPQIFGQNVTFAFFVSR